jgi:POT family proton-dependent oligopeptide transporter
VLEGVSGDIFKIVDALITIIPLAIITYVLFRLFQKTFKNYALANIILAFSFIIIWGLAVMKVYNDYKSASYVVEYVNNNGVKKTTKVVTFTEFTEGEQMPILDNEAISIYDPTAKGNEKNSVKNNYLYNEKDKPQGEIFEAKAIKIIERDKVGAGIKNTYATFGFLNSMGESKTKEVKLTGAQKELKVGDTKQLLIAHAIKYDNQDKKEMMAMVKAKESAVEIGATWFNILNSLFIIALAPLFSRWWESKYNPTANGKYAIGMALLGLGMLVVAIGSSGIAPGQESASTSMFILVFVYLFHTMGELCVSPVALSYVSKLVPGRMIAMMFGLWYIAVAIGMKLAGIFGEMSQGIAKEEGVSRFFWYLTAISVILSLLAWITTPFVKKLMHGVK